jgi:hypothetical protein
MGEGGRDQFLDRMRFGGALVGFCILCSDENLSAVRAFGMKNRGNPWVLGCVVLVVVGP